MQFLRVSVLALSLVCQILAAPAILNTNVPAVDTVIRAVENLETSLNGMIVSPVRGAINPLVGRDTSAVITILGAVQSLETNVAVDLASLTTAVGEDVTTAVVPTVIVALNGIETSLHIAVDTIVPAVGSIVVPLAKNEVAALVTALQDLHALVADIQSALRFVVTTLSADAKALIASEVTEVLNIILPVVGPVAQFSLHTVGAIVGSDGLVAQIKTLAESALNIVDGLLDPVGEVLAALTS